VSVGNERVSIEPRARVALFRRLDHSRCHVCASYPGCFAVDSRGSRSRVFCFFLASARRSVFFRRLARFLALSLPLLFPIRPAYSGRELVDGPVVVIAPMNGRAVKVSQPIDDQPVIGKRAIWGALEEMNYSFGPLAAANGT
jgi:hypothetical protein